MPVQTYTQDIITKLITLLSSPNWSAGTGGTQPTIQKWTNDFTLQLNNGDYILIKVITEEINGFGLYGNDWLHNLPIVLFVTSYTSQDRATQIVNEVLRLIGNNVRLTDYIDLLFVGINDNSYEMINKWEYVINLQTRRNDTVA